MRVAVTGGTGFVGKALIRLLVAEKHAVTALARDPAKIADFPQVKTIAGDLTNIDALNRLTDGSDVVFHLAGVTHAKSRAEYLAVNSDGAIAVATATQNAGSRLVQISSLSAREPELSPYSRSKYEAERRIADLMDKKDWLALRLPAIYGPGDVATLPFFKLVKAGIAPHPSTKPPARASILNVDDAASAIMAGAKAPPGSVYDVGDDRPNGYAWPEIADLLGDALGVTPRHIGAPKAVIRLYYPLVRWFETASGKTPSIREGQVNEFFHPDWVARDNLLSSVADWRPSITLKEGFAKTVIWYQENGLI